MFTKFWIKIKFRILRPFTHVRSRGECLQLRMIGSSKGFGDNGGNDFSFRHYAYNSIRIAFKSLLNWSRNIWKQIDGNPFFLTSSQAEGFVDTSTLTREGAWREEKDRNVINSHGTVPEELGNKSEVYLYDINANDIQAMCVNQFGRAERKQFSFTAYFTHADINSSALRHRRWRRRTYLVGIDSFGILWKAIWFTRDVFNILTVNYACRWRVSQVGAAVAAA